MEKYTGTFEQYNYVATADAYGATITLTMKTDMATAITEFRKYNRGEAATGTDEAWVAEILDGTQAKENMKSIVGLMDNSNWMLYSEEITGVAGGICDLRITIKGKRNVLTAGLDFTTFSRPILGYVLPGEALSSAEKRVTKLVQWQNMKTRDYLTEYINYQYRIPSDSTTSVASTDSSYFLLPSTNDRYIADKIKRGIESYEMYAPVVTLNMSSMRVPSLIQYGDGDLRLSQIGTQGAFPDLQLTSTFWVMPASVIKKVVNDAEKSLLAIYKTLPDKAKEPSETREVSLTWVITGDHMSMSNDLTFNRRIQLTGFTDVDADLYPKRSDVFSS